MVAPSTRNLGGPNPGSSTIWFLGPKQTKAPSPCIPEHREGAHTPQPVCSCRISIPTHLQQPPSLHALHQLIAIKL